MIVLRPRSRTISVRISEEEFSALRRICVASGARSLSDLAREAMHGLLNRAGKENGGDGAREEVYAQMKDLEQRVQELSVEVASIKANRNS
jgi:hypothetical protein